MVEEGYDTYFVDNPIILANWESYHFKIRISTAVCFKNASTKNWTRISLDKPVSKDDKNLDTLSKLYNQITDVCCSISHKNFSSIVQNELNQNSKMLDDFKIFTFGVKDEQLGEFLENLDDVDLQIRDLFTENDSAEKIIKDYYTSLFTASSNDIIEENKYNFWMSSRTNVLKSKWNDQGINKKYYDYNNVLYKIMVNDNGIIALGMGYEDSMNKEIAHLSTLQIARLYGKNI